MSDLTLLKKKLYYQSCHRGCKETDYILGNFAKTYIDSFNEEQLALYEEFIKQDDWDIYAWVSGKKTMPANLENEVSLMILQSVGKPL